MPTQPEQADSVASDRTFELLVGSVRDYAIFMLDAAGNVRTWNLGARAIKGYAPEEIIGKSLDQFYTPEDRAAGLPRRLLDIARRDGRVENEGWRVRKDGTKFFADVIITAVYDEQSDLVGFVKVTRDLTERREADLERLRLAQAEEAVRLRDDFLSIASHELRTPLMSLQLQIESLQRLYATTDEKLGGKLGRAERSVRRLTELVEALLDVTRIATGRLTVHPARVDLAEVVSEVIDRMNEAVAQSGCKLTMSIEPGIVGSWDALRMGQVVTNLLSNSLKYAAGAAIHIVLRKDGDRVELEMSDTGPGIEASRIDHVFERFERSADQRHHGGLGLGLYVARQIVAAHRGTIRAENWEGGGARFTIQLPARGLEG